MSAPTDDEDSGGESQEELERRAEQAQQGENTISFEEYRERRDEA